MQQGFEFAFSLGEVCRLHGCFAVASNVRAWAQAGGIAWINALFLPALFSLRRFGVLILPEDKI